MNDLWHKFLVWFGLAEQDRQDYDQPEPRRRSDPFEGDEQVEERPRNSHNVRKLTRTEPGRPIVRPVPNPSSSLHVIEPRSFNDAPKIADRLKRDEPVIMNLQSLSPELSQRLMDFVSGSTYSLGGRVQQVGDKVILITPSNVEVSDEERRRLQEKGFFFSAGTSDTSRRRRQTQDRN